MEKISKRLVSWASILEESTRDQAVTASGMPFIYPHLALMPDAHLGKGATVGSAIPTLGAVIPAAVGVDIGCGMTAVRTQYVASDLPMNDRGRLRVAIERAIPLSAGRYNTAVSRAHTEARFADLESRADTAGVDPAAYAARWRPQLGTLGSGNHFLEISLDQSERVWLFLHSGSRGVGNKIAQHHIKVAQAVMKKWWITLPDPDLAYLVEDTDEFSAYLRELGWAQSFALSNRAEMMDRVVDCFATWINGPVERQQEVDRHHNYTESERHFGKQVWLSRKGAINASEGTCGLIPGSMGSRSYVVRGKGNAMALNSAPHGAGREYSRSRARKTFTRDDLRAAMSGIEYRDTAAFIDEIPAAYKDIDVVMKDADDLVQVCNVLRQIVNVKGD
jgi:tRNA-splicing ligase RtcB (3'-phosphate/5'-hydroxy nucleic acid ligase)